MNVSEYLYNIIVVDENDEVGIYSGVSSGNDLHAMAQVVVEAHTDWFDPYCDALTPTIEIERDSDGNFIVNVDSHGLGSAGIVLTGVK